MTTPADTSPPATGAGGSAPPGSAPPGPAPQSGPPGDDTTHERSGLGAAIGAAAAEAAASAAADLPGRAADAVVHLVDALHDKAVRPAILAARAAVYGLLVAAMGAILLIVGSIALIRLLDVYAFGERVWASYLLVGGVLTLAGLALWSRRAARPAPSGRS